MTQIDVNAPQFEKDVKPLLDQVCKECHLNLTFKTGFEQNRIRMLDAVKGGRMPRDPKSWGVPEKYIPRYRDALRKVMENYR